MIYETTYSNARAHLASLMDQVTDTREPILIRRRGAEPSGLSSRNGDRAIYRGTVPLRIVAASTSTSR